MDRTYWMVRDQAECIDEIDRLKAELEEANTIANDNYQVILKCNGKINELKRQLAEARAENERLKADLKYVGEHCVNPEEQAVMIAEARQEAAREILKLLDSKVRGGQRIDDFYDEVCQKFGLEG